MKNRIVAAMAVAAVLVAGLGSQAQASLVVTGTVDYDGAARNLIYDTDLNITWLDYTKGVNFWSNQMAWASSLELIVNGVACYDNWRLPNTVDDSPVYSQPLMPDNYWYSGEYSFGYNNTSSEMAHLYYTELGNKGYLDTAGDYLQDYGLNNVGPFQNLVSSWYWSSTEYPASPGFAWGFDTHYGMQNFHGDNFFYALSVHPGLVGAAPVPEPASVLLIGAGLAGLAGVGRRRRGH